MPRLNGIEDKTLFGLQVDKENAEVFFNDEKHEYRDKTDGSKYISVTQLIHTYKPSFDSDFWSSYKAAEALFDTYAWEAVKPVLLSTKKWNNKLLETYKVDKSIFDNKRQEILRSYDEKREASCKIGTEIHLEKELSFYNEDTRDLKKFGLGGKFDCEKGYYKLDRERCVYPEFLISYKFPNGLKISGQIDLLIKDGNDIYLIDWKSNDSIDKKSYFDKKSNSYQMLKHPVNNIMDCNYMVYTLQLSTYFYLLKQINPEFRLKKLSLIHIDKKTRKETEYACEYLEEDVKRMLNHYASKQLRQSVIDRDKEIEF